MTDELELPKKLRAIYESDPEVRGYVDRLRSLVIVDERTGLYNSRHFQRTLDSEMNRAMRGQEPLSLALVDYDLFHNLNAEYGHPFCNEVLRLGAETIKRNIREHDFAFRWGGEEKAVILPLVNIGGARQFAETIRKRISELDVFEALQKEIRRYRDSNPQRAVYLEELLNSDLVKGRPPPHVRVSIGVGTYPNKDIISASGLLSKTFHALYLAKNTGRNKVCTIYNLP